MWWEECVYWGGGRGVVILKEGGMEGGEIEVGDIGGVKRRGGVGLK